MEFFIIRDRAFLFRLLNKTKQTGIVEVWTIAMYCNAKFYT